jgi:hypothetical protein
MVTKFVRIAIPSPVKNTPIINASTVPRRL